MLCWLMRATGMLLLLENGIGDVLLDVLTACDVSVQWVAGER